MVEVEVSVAFTDEGMLIGVIGLVELLETYGEAGRQQLVSALQVITEKIAESSIVLPACDVVQ